MESWQIKCINSDMVELVKNTNFNTILEAHLIQEEVISTADVEDLKAKSKRNGSNLVKLLFLLLQKRVDSYRAIGKATYETAQSGTFLTLLRGLVLHVLEQHGISMNEVILDGILKAHLHNGETLKFFMAKIKNPTLLEDHWVPPFRRGIYIPRHISNRVKLNAAASKEKSSDVFVFIGLSLPALSQLAHLHATIVSSTVILEKNTSTRFVLLEMAQHWERLEVVLAEHTTKRGIHLVQFENLTKEYILQKSTGPVNTIAKHLSSNQRTKPLYISEQDFCSQIDKLKNVKVVCLCDTAGMGKTWLLESMARAESCKDSNTLVVFIAIQDLIQYVTSSAGNEDTSYLSLLRYLWPTPFIPTVVSRLTEEKIKLDLYLDGFDEISKKHLEIAKRFLGSISKMKSVRVFITSRPEMRKELEDTLHTIAHDVLPFSQENQVDYLVAFWKTSKKKPEDVQEDKLKIFAEACLQNLRSFLTKSDGDLMGIPLQCFLLASINQDNAYLYCWSNEDCQAEDFISLNCVNDMFRRYVEMGLNKATGDGNTNMSHIDSRALIHYHVWRALETVFPDLAEDYFQSQKLTQREPSPQDFACGLLKISSAEHPIKTTFIHRTFAEYLVAGAFADIVTGEHKLTEDKVLRKFVTVLVKTVLDVDFSFCFILKSTRNKDIARFDVFDFENEVIAHFLNASLVGRSLDSIPKQVASQVVPLLPDGFSPILSAAIKNGYVGICRMVSNVLYRAHKTKISFQRGEVHKLLNNSGFMEFDKRSDLMDQHEWDYFAYLCLAARHSNDIVVKELYSLFEKCTDKNLDKIFGILPNHVAMPLHYALRASNYALVEYFSSRIRLEKRKLLYCAVRNTKFWEPQDLAVIKLCCERLLGICKAILQEKYMKKIDTPILAPDAHLELVNFLLQKGVNISGEIVYDENNVLWHIRWLNDGRHGKPRLPASKKRASQLFQPQLQKWNDALQNVNGATRKIKWASIDKDKVAAEVDVLKLHFRGEMCLRRCGSMDLVSSAGLFYEMVHER